MLNINTKTFFNIILLAFSTFLSGCSTWHENLMTNEQLIAANCSELATEERKVAENAAHTSEASSGGMVGSMFLLVLEAIAGSKTNTPIDTNNSGAVTTAGLSDEHAKQASELESRKNMITMIRAKKRCT